MPFLSLVIVGVMIFAIVDLITRDQSQIKHLPKFGWIILVILLPFIGSVLWFTLGREYAPRAPRSTARSVAREAPPAPPRDMRSTEQQLADLDREIEADRLRAEIARKRAERDGS